MFRGLKGALRLIAAMFMVGLSLTATPVKAADGCVVMVCMAGNWRNHAMCIPPVNEALRDVARGRAWPECREANQTVTTTRGNTTSTMTLAYAPGNCPRQYAQEISVEGSSWWVCRWTRVIIMTIDGQPWLNTWADDQGNTSTEYFAAARAQLRAEDLDPTFENDLAAYIAAEAARQQPIGDGYVGG